MEIVKHGSSMKIRTCSNCGCEFKFSKSKEKYTYMPSPFDEQFLESYHFINCPECEQKIEV